MNPINKNILSIVLASCLLSLVTASAQAAELYFGAHSKEVGVGKTFEIGVLLNTQNQFVNAVEGKIIFPNDLEIVDILDGNSIINLWVEKPHLAESGKIFFSGIVPGGYLGERGYLFSLVLKAKSTGQTTITTSDERILLNDGEATGAPVHRAPISLSVVSGTAIEPFLPPHDPDLPEAFTPAVAQDPNLFDNQYFVVFLTQDKGSGIDHYEILETRNPLARFKTGKSEGMRGWRIGDSPYLLQNQKLTSYIFVKAIDKAGNERVSMLSPKNPLLGYKDYKLWIIIILIGFMLYLATHRSLWKTVISTLKLRR